MAAGTNGTQGHYDFDVDVNHDPSAPVMPDAGNGLYTMTVIDVAVKAADKDVTTNGETKKRSIPNIRYTIRALGGAGR